MMKSYISLNINGFTNEVKRFAFYKLLKKHKAIGLLQETFTNDKDVEKIKSEWGQGVIASNGVGKSAGVMILIPDNVP